MARASRIFLITVFLLVFARFVYAVVLQSVPPGLEIFNFLNSPHEEQVIKNTLYNSPEVHFFMAKNAKSIVSRLKHYVKGFVFIKNNPWYLLNTIWFVLLSISIGIGLLVFAVSLTNIFQTAGLIAHGIKENRLMGALLFAPLAGFFGIKYLLLSLVFLSFSFVSTSRRVLGQFLVVLMVISVMIMYFVFGSVWYCSSKRFRQTVDVNTGNLLSPAYTLSSSTDYKERFSYLLSLQLSGDLSGAIDGYRSLMSRANDGRILVNLGNCYFMLGKISEARQAYKKAIDKGVGFSAYYNLSVLEREELNFQKADEYYKKASEIDIDKITSLKATALYGPMILNEYLSPIEISTMGLVAGFKSLINPKNLVFIVAAFVTFAGLILLKSQSNNVKLCPKCGTVYCSKCSKNTKERKICNLCFQTLIAIGLPLEKRVAHLIASQQYRTRRRRLLLIESFVFPWIILTSSKGGSFVGFIMGGLLYLFISIFVVSKTFYFNTIGFLKPIGTLSLGIAILIYLAGIYIGYRTYKSGGL